MVILTIVAILATFLSRTLLPSVQLQQIAQTILLTIGLVYTPNIASFVSSFWGQENRIIQAVMEIVLFTILILGVGILTFGTAVVGSWVFYVFAFIVIIDGGGHFLEKYKQDTINRLRKDNLFSGFQDEVDEFNSLFSRGRLIYSTIPSGLFLGTLGGLIVGYSPQETTLLCLVIILIAAWIVIAVLLAVTALRMATPLFTVEQASITLTATPDNRVPTGVLGWIARITRRTSSSDPISPKENPEEKAIKLALIATHIRKLYLYDGTHNSILLVAIGAGIVSFTRTQIETGTIVISTVALSLLISQIPYIVGQTRLYNELLETFDDTLVREKLHKKLTEEAPLYPRSAVISALGATAYSGAAGIIVNSFLKSLTG